MNVQCPSCETIYRIDPAKVPDEGVRARCAVCSFAIELAAPDSSIAPAPPVIDEAPLAAPEPDVVAHISPDGPALAEPTTDEEPAATGDTEQEPAAATEETPPEPEPVRMSRPFVASDAGVAEAPPEEARPVTRPTAPVFKPTPDAPVQHAQVPPAVSPAPEPPAVSPPPESEVVSPPQEPEVAAPLAPEPEVAAPAAPEPVSEPVAEAAEEVAPTVIQPAIEIPQPTAPAAPAKPVNPFLQRDPKQKARRLARALISDMIVYQPQKRQETLENGTLKEAFEEEIKKSWEEYVDQVGQDMAKSTTFFKDALNEILAGGSEVF